MLQETPSDLLQGAKDEGLNLAKDAAPSLH